MNSSREWPSVAVVCIGTELTTGHIKDSNAHLIAKTLSEAGASVVSMRFVPDDLNIMVQAMRDAMELAAWVVVTGGLGPTDDDFTKDALLQIFGGELVMHAPSLERVESSLSKRGVPLTARNRSQAEVPSSCVPLLNRWGLAPGMLFKRNGHTLVSLPGVPKEMEGLLKYELIPRMQAEYGELHYVDASFSIYGVAESVLAERLEDFESTLAPYFSLAYLPGGNSLVELRLRSLHPVEGDMMERFSFLCSRLRDELGDDIFSECGESLAEVVHGLLMARHLTLSTAESCTSGELAAALTECAGSSSYFLGSVIAYSHGVKSGKLGVSSQLLSSQGAVNEEVVLQMAQGARLALQSDLAISTTGLLGPEGDGSDVKVGTLFVGISDAQGYSECYSTTLSGSRLYARRSATNFALNILRSYLAKER